MAPAGESSTSDKKEVLTPRDLEILSAAWNCMKTQPEMDYEKLAAACGMTNPRSASNAWSSIKKKLFANVPPAGDANGGKAPKTPASSKKRKAKTTDDTVASPAPDGGEDTKEEAEATPVKKRARAKPKPKVKAQSKVKDEDTSDNNEEVIKKKKVTAQQPKEEPKSDNDSDDGAEGADMVLAYVVNDGEV